MSQEVLVRFNDDARKAAFERTGHVPENVVMLDFSGTSPEDRKLVADAAKFERGGTGRLELYISDARDVTAEAAIECLRRESLAKMVVEETRRRESDEMKKAAQLHASLAVAFPIDLWINHRYPHPEDYHYSYNDDYTAAFDAVAGVKEKRNEAEREKDRRKAEAAAAQEKEQRALREEKEMKNDQLMTWAWKNGSKKTTMLLDEGHKHWRESAVSDFFEFFRPAGFAEPPDGARLSERTKPEIDDLIALKSARNLVQSADKYPLSDPKMVWMVLYRSATDEDDPHDVDDDNEVLVEKFGAIELTITAPTGATKTVYNKV